MVKLTCLNSVSRWKNKQISLYPQLLEPIRLLENKISEKPEHGFYDPDAFSIQGKIIPYYKRSLRIFLFPYQYAIGYSYITATYLFNKTSCLIVNMAFC